MGGHSRFANGLAAASPPITRAHLFPNTVGRNKSDVRIDLPHQQIISGFQLGIMSRLGGKLGASTPPEIAIYAFGGREAFDRVDRIAMRPIPAAGAIRPKACDQRAEIMRRAGIAMTSIAARRASKHLARFQYRDFRSHFRCGEPGRQSGEAGTDDGNVNLTFDRATLRRIEGSGARLPVGKSRRGRHGSKADGCRKAADMRHFDAAIIETDEPGHEDVAFADLLDALPCSGGGRPRSRGVRTS